MLRMMPYDKAGYVLLYGCWEICNEIYDEIHPMIKIL